MEKKQNETIKHRDAERTAGREKLRRATISSEVGQRRRLHCQPLLAEKNTNFPVKK